MGGQNDSPLAPDSRLCMSVPLPQGSYCDCALSISIQGMAAGDHRFYLEANNWRLCAIHIRYSMTMAMPMRPLE